MKENTRVLILSTAYLPKLGGSELAIKNITDRLPEIKFDLITSRSSKNLPHKEKIGNVNVYRVGNWMSLSSFLFPKNLFPIPVFLKARELIKQNGPYDLVHAYQASQAAGGGWLLKWFYPRTPFLLTIQEGKALERQSMLLKLSRRFIFKKINAATAISIYLADYIKKQSPKVSVTIIPNGVDLDKFKIKNDSFHETQGYLEQGRMDEKLKINEKTVVTVSRLVEKNGVGDLIDAFCVLNSKFKIQNSKLLIIGDGPLKESLKLKVKNLGLEDKINFIGEVSHDEVPDYLAQADVFVRPSLSEGLGNAFLEAMAMRIPVVGTPVGGIPDFIIDGETGLFCKPGNSEDIAAQINKVLSDGGLAKKLSFRGRKLVEDKYSWDKIAEKFREQYNIIIQQ